jgi:hypothetical protein
LTRDRRRGKRTRREMTGSFGFEYKGIYTFYIHRSRKRISFQLPSSTCM